MSVIYGLAIDGWVRTIDPDTRQEFTLVTAMRAAYGCGGARVMRAEPRGRWVPVVEQAGSSYAVTHAPTRRRIVRRIARHLRSI